MVSLVGLAADFSLHLSHAYQESKGATRELKVRDALLTLGGSVISAAITTILSALVLAAGTYVIFFQKFGTFILLTILFSVFWAFLFLMALCAIMGRIRPHNDILWLWRRLTCQPNKAPSPAAGKQHEMQRRPRGSQGATEGSKGETKGSHAEAPPSVSTTVVQI